jgi:hypothetical protein
MAWQVLGDGDGTAYAPKIANSVGLSLDSLLEKFFSEGRQLETAIGQLKTQISTDVNALNTAFSPALDTDTKFEEHSVPDDSLSNDLVPPPEIEGSFPDLATIPSIGTAPDPGTVPTWTAPTGLLGSIPSITAFSKTQAAAPDGPSPGNTLLSDAAYTGAFALARDAALQEEQRALWDASHAAAANGIGLPLASKQAALRRAQVARQQAISRAASEQATLKASHLRDDEKWAYEQQLRYWLEERKLELEQWMQEEMHKINAWATLNQRNVEIWATREGRHVEIWANRARTEMDLWRAKAQENRTDAIQRLEAEIARYKEDYTLRLTRWDKEKESITQKFSIQVQAFQQELANEARRLQWKQDTNATELERTKFDVESSLRMQEFAANLSQQAMLAYAGARAEYVKALGSQVSYSASTSGSGSWSNSYSYSESCSKDDC